MLAARWMHASVAQLAEHLICNQAVASSSLAAGSSGGSASVGEGDRAPARAVHWKQRSLDDTGAVSARRPPGRHGARDGPGTE